MAKKITHLSKLPKYRKEYVTELLKGEDVNTIEVNSKKGIIVEFDEDEYLIILDHLLNNVSDEDDDDDDDMDDDIDDDDLDIDDELNEEL